MSDAKHEQKSRGEALDALASLITEIRVGMLTTASDDGTLRSRPMITAATKFDGDLWFLTEADEPKVAEIQAHHAVNVAYACPERQQYVSISGDAEIVHDRTKSELLWEDEYERWFPEGTKATDLSLIKVSISGAEYWDAHRRTMIQVGGVPVPFGIFAGGEEEVEHERIDFPD